MCEMVPWVGEVGLALGEGQARPQGYWLCLGAYSPVGLHVTPASCRYHLEQLPSYVSTRLLTCEMQPIIVAALQPSDISKMRIP